MTHFYQLKKKKLYEGSLVNFTKAITNTKVDVSLQRRPKAGATCSANEKKNYYSINRKRVIFGNLWLVVPLTLNEGCTGKKVKKAVTVI